MNLNKEARESRSARIKKRGNPGGEDSTFLRTQNRCVTKTTGHFDKQSSPSCRPLPNPAQMNGMSNQVKPESSVDFAQLSDSEIVAACLERDSAAWEALIFRYQRLIYSIPIKMGFSTVDAADVFQSVCLVMIERLPTLRKHEKISSWLMTTATRECWRVAARWRREGQPSRHDPDQPRDRLSELASDAPLADEQREEIEQQQIIRQAITALPDRCRRLITMLFYEKDNLSYGDIARRMRMPVASVGPTRARCLEKLKKSLDGKI